MQLLKKYSSGLVLLAVIVLAGAITHPQPAHGAGSAPVTVVNTTPVPVTGTISGNITGQVSVTNDPSVHAIQSGAWTVGLGAGSEKLDTANAHLWNIENSVGQLHFDPAGSLRTTVQGPISTTAAVLTKAFALSLRLDPFADSGDIPVTVNGSPATINMTMLVLCCGHDNESVFVRGPFLNGSAALRLPVLIDSQTAIVQFQTPIPTSSVLIQCDNGVEHCDFGLDILGF